MITVKEEFLASAKVSRAIKLGGYEVLAVWLAMKGFCASRGDGFVPDESFDDLPGLPRNARAALRSLVECGVLSRDCPGDCPGGLSRGHGLVDTIEGGWLLHDYEDHCMGRDEFEERKRRAREKKAKQRLSGKNRWKSPKDASEPGLSLGGQSPGQSRDSLESPCARVLPSPLLSSEREKEIPPTPLPNRDRPRDRLAESFDGVANGGAEVRQVFDAWKVSVGLPSSAIRKPFDPRIDHIKSSIQTYGLQECLLVASHCMNDGMVNGKTDEKRVQHKTIDYIFGNPATFERILHAAQEHTKPAVRKMNPSEQLRRHMESDR